MKINEIELNDRPREKMIAKGSASLSNIELLAIMLASGSKSESVLDMSARLINEYGFDRLFNMSYYELKEIKGIKDAKATRLMALFEIARRVKDIKSNSSCFLRSSSDVFNYIKNEYLFLKTEVVKVIYTNKNMEVIKVTSFNEGGVSNINVPFRSIISEAINLKAYGLFLCHNHPSGDLNPSMSDIETTLLIRDLLDSIDVRLFDHLIIHMDKFYSFADNKTLENL